MRQQFGDLTISLRRQTRQHILDIGIGKYRARGEPIHLIGVEFSKASRNIVGFEIETLFIK